MKARAARCGLTLLLVGLIGGFAACSARVPIRGQETTGLDRKLSTFAYIEEGDLVVLIVDTKATMYRGDTPYIPLEICIANRGLRQLNLTRESFILVDSRGNRYPAATPTELMRNYDYLDLDREALGELESITFNKFATYSRYRSKFSPSRSVSPQNFNLVQDVVTLPKFGYLLDFIYFTMPATGVKGQRFELFVESPDLPDPVFVKFEVL